MNNPVGYKRPPIATRWKKGESGNPKGRAKGHLNLKTDLLAELSEVIQINEGGAPRRISKQRALLKALTARGIQGDSRAANLMLNLMMRLIDPEPIAMDAAEISPEDEAALEAYIARRVAEQEDKK